MSSIGIVIGRFQTAAIPDELRRVIDDIAEKHDTLAIAIGIHKSGATRRNPLGYTSGASADNYCAVYPNHRVAMDPCAAVLGSSASVATYGSAHQAQATCRTKSTMRHFPGVRAVQMAIY